MIVGKFGGSSLKGPEGLKNCFNVLKEVKDLRVIVISATFNTTNILENLCEKSLERDFQGSVQVLKELKEKHLRFSKNLGLEAYLNNSIEELILKAQSFAVKFLQTERMCPQTMDSLYSIGELLSANLFQAYLKKNMPNRTVHLLDARSIIKTDSNFGKAKANELEISIKVKENLSPLLKDDDLVVIPGFIAEDLKGNTTTLGREGSDLSAALISKALSADELHIYKDVAGIFSADPKLVTGSLPIKELDFETANQLSTLGAKVLCPSALKPVMQTNTKVFIGSTQNPGLGTQIVKHKLNNKFSGITLRSGFFRLDLEKKDQTISYDNFKNNILEILAEKDITPINKIYQGESLSLIFSSKVNIPPEVKNHFREFCQVSQENRVSLVSIIGSKIKEGREKINKGLENLYLDKVSLGEVENGPNHYTFAFPSRFEDKVLNDLHQHLFS